jgi:peptide/nickel transport system permease protein
MTSEASLDAVAAAGGGEDAAAPAMRWRGGAWRRFRSERGAVIGLAILLILVIAAIFAPLIMPYGATQQGPLQLAGPSGKHWLGTDELGRDQLTRLVYGARESLIVAVGSAIVGLVIGVPIGLLAGYLGKLWDAIPMRVMDFILALPYLLVALVVVTILGSSTFYLVLAIGFAAVPGFARLTRASAMALREADFVVATRAMGAGKGDTMVRTVLPNTLAPIIVQFVVTASVAVVVAAALSFISLGPPPPAPSWGGMLQTAEKYLYTDPWYAIFPGVALAVMVACFDRIGHGLQRAIGAGSDSSVQGRT